MSTELSEEAAAIRDELGAQLSLGVNPAAALERVLGRRGHAGGRALVSLVLEGFLPEGCEVCLAGVAASEDDFNALSTVSPSDGRHELAVFVSGVTAARALEGTYLSPDMAVAGASYEDLAVLTASFQEVLEYARSQGCRYLALEPDLLGPDERRVTVSAGEEDR